MLPHKDQQAPRTHAGHILPVEEMRLLLRHDDDDDDEDDWGRTRAAGCTGGYLLMSKGQSIRCPRGRQANWGGGGRRSGVGGSFKVRRLVRGLFRQQHPGEEDAEEDPREAPWGAITFPSADGRTEEEAEEGGCTRFHCSAAAPHH